MSSLVCKTRSWLRLAIKKTADRFSFYMSRISEGGGVSAAKHCSFLGLQKWDRQDNNSHFNHSSLSLFGHHFHSLALITVLLQTKTCYFSTFITEKDSPGAWGLPGSSLHFITIYLTDSLSAYLSAHNMLSILA
jgi:hypothetical protein